MFNTMRLNEAHDNNVLCSSVKELRDNGFSVIAGPCSVESPEQMIEIARAVKSSGAIALRGGIFKPRTSPFSFQGLGEEGLPFLVDAGRESGLPTVSEITDKSQLDLMREVSVLQVGARNMQNYELLKALGKSDKTILLKRGVGATLDEWLMSARYITSGGNPNVILCERGMRTFEPLLNTALDVSIIPLIKERTDLPIFIDPSHATGDFRLVRPVALAAAIAGADGLLIEVHNNPEAALCDGQQSLTPVLFDSLMQEISLVLQHFR